MSIHKWLINSGLCLVFGLSTLIGASLLTVSLLLFTHTGNQAMIKLAKQFESRFSIELIEGSLFRSPQFSTISWVDGETQIHIAHLDYQFDWSCLQNTLCLDVLNVNGIQAHLPETAPAPEAVTDNVDETPLEIDIPLKIIVGAINISDLHVERGALSVDLEKFSLQADALHKDVTLASQIAGLLVTLPDSEAIQSTPIVVTPEAKKPLDLNIASLPAILTQAMLPSISLPVNLTVQPLLIERVAIHQNQQVLFTLNALQSAFTFKETQLSVSQFDLNLPETALSLRADINFIEDYPLHLRIDGEVKNVKQLQPETLLSGLHYSLNSEGRLSDLNSELSLSNTLQVALSSHLDLLSPNLPHAVTLDWQALQWPLQGTAQYSAQQGHFSSQGSLVDHSIELRSDYALADMPGGMISLHTQGDLQQLQVNSLKVETLSGEVDFSGLLTWQDSLNWLGKLQISDIDLAPLNTEYDGHFSGLVEQHVVAHLFENAPPEWQFDFANIDIVGELLARPLSVNGRVYGDHLQGISIDDLAIINAKNRVLITGQVAQQNDLVIDVDIDALGDTLLGAQGQIAGQVSVQGPMDALQVNSQLSSEQLSYLDYQIQSMQLASTLLLSAQPQLRLDLVAQDITASEQVIDDINVTVRHQAAEQGQDTHQVALALHSELLSTEATLSLMQTDDALLATLEQAKLDLGHQTLTLLESVDINALPQQVTITPHCWQAATSTLDDAGKVCVKQFNAGESGQVDLDIEHYQLAMANSFLPNEINVFGALSADAQVQWEKAQPPRFDLSLLSEDMLIKIKPDNDADNDSEYPMQTLDINVQGRDDVMDVNAKLYAQNLLDIAVEGKVQAYQTSPTINAKVHSIVPDFSAFLALVPTLEVMQGQLLSELTIDGPLTQPEIIGSIDISQGAVSGADIPIKVSQLAASIAIDKNKATMTGRFDSSDTNTLVEKTVAVPLITNTLNLLDKTVKKVSSTLVDTPAVIETQPASLAPGVATFVGNADWSDTLTGDIHFMANQLEVYDYGKIDLLISPDMHLLLNEHLSVTGKLLVDKGKVVVAELPAGAVSQSADIVVIDVETDNTQQALPIVIDLEVDTGSDLQIVALGLDTFMEGKLSIQQPLHRDLSINGVLDLSEGSYRSMGQQLVLQDSRIIFQGSPEAPYLQIEAIRDPSEVEDDVVAGVRVTGLPDELELIIFSEPAMAQQEALSYLTRGQAIGSASESGTMANMLIDLAAGQSGGLMSTIGEEVGIKDLALESSGSGDEQSVGISGEVAPGVELSYGVGVFESFSIISLRYELFERFYVEASSGIYQAVDAYYEWDWD